MKRDTTDDAGLVTHVVRSFLVMRLRLNVSRCSPEGTEVGAPLAPSNYIR